MQDELTGGKIETMAERVTRPAESLSEPGCFGRMVRVHPLTISAVYKHGDQVGQAYVLNLSLGGVFMTTDRAFSIGERLRLRFFLPFQVGPVDALAVVRWCSKDQEDSAAPRTGYGLEFSEIEPASRENVARFIDKFVQLADQLEA